MCGYFCTGFINFMFNGNSLADSTNLFSPNNFKKNDNIILMILMMSFNDQHQFRLNEINEIKYYFVAKIKEKELMSKRLLLTIIVLFAASGIISIASF